MAPFARACPALDEATRAGRPSSFSPGSPSEPFPTTAAHRAEAQLTEHELTVGAQLSHDFRFPSPLGTELTIGPILRLLPVLMPFHPGTLSQQFSWRLMLRMVRRSTKTCCAGQCTGAQSYRSAENYPLYTAKLSFHPRPKRSRSLSTSVVLGTVNSPYRTAFTMSRPFS